MNWIKKWVPKLFTVNPIDEIAYDLDKKEGWEVKSEKGTPYLAFSKGNVVIRYYEYTYKASLLINNKQVILGSKESDVLCAAMEQFQRRSREQENFKLLKSIEL